MWVFIKMKALSELVKSEPADTHKKKKKTRENISDFLLIRQTPSIGRANIYKTLDCYFNSEKMAVTTQLRWDGRLDSQRQATLTVSKKLFLLPTKE